MIDANLHGVILALDRNLARQEILVNDTTIVVKKPEYLPFNQPYLPLQPSRSYITSGNLIFNIANNAIVIVNITGNSFSYRPYNLDCTPFLLTAPVPSGVIYGQCPNNRLFAINYTSVDEPPAYFKLRVQETVNFNGMLIIGPAPNYALHYLTGRNENVIFYDIFGDNSASVPVPSCSYVSNIEDISNTNFAILCASDATSPFNVTSIHFRNLTVNDYVSVNLSRPITRKPIIKWVGSIVLLADRGSLHVFDRVSRQYKSQDVTENVTDITVVNTTLAYYTTSNLVKFSPLDILRGLLPTAQNLEPACGPPSCAYTSSVAHQGVLYSTTNTSFSIRENDITIGQGNLDIAPQLFLHNLTYRQTTQNAHPSATPTTSPVKFDYKIYIYIIATVVVVIIISIAIIVTCIAVVLLCKSHHNSNIKPSTEESSIEGTSLSPFSEEHSTSSPISNPTEDASTIEQVTHPIQESNNGDCRQCTFQ